MLPLLLIVALGLVQVGLLLRDQLHRRYLVLQRHLQDPPDPLGQLRL